jgi:multidrug transporter EmrE-like cation transporter
MNAVSFSLILSGVTLNAVAQLLLKAGTRNVGHFAFTWENALPISTQMLTSLPILGGLTCYVASVVVWIMALSRVDVSIAYPMLSIGYVLNALLAWWLFGEAVTAQRIAGITIIIIGVVVVARS